MADDSELRLTAPAAVPAVAADKAAGLVPLDDGVRSELAARVDGFVQALLQKDANSPEFGQQVDRLAALGQAEIARTAAQSNRFLDMPVRAMDQEAGIGANLVELRRTVESLDPARQRALLSPRRLLGLIPFGSNARRYFDGYKSAQGHISAILKGLADGKDQLLHDNAAIDTERQSLWQAMGRLEQMVHMSKLLDGKLEAAATELDAADPAKARAVRETALFQVRQRTTDLLTQMAVSVQGYLALDLVKKNNLELLKGVDRASTTTVAALRTAVTVAQALTGQKLVLDQIRALNTTTADIIAATGDLLSAQSSEIHRQAASSTVPLETLKKAFGDIYSTFDSIDRFKLDALASMKTTVDSLSAEVDRAQQFIARSGGGAPALAAPAGDGAPVLAPVDGT